MGGGDHQGDRQEDRRKGADVPMEGEKVVYEFYEEEVKDTADD